MVILTSYWLPSPEILKLSIDKILGSFDDVVQVELVKTRWEEIERLQSQSALVDTCYQQRSKRHNILPLLV